jgi:hypothetical protein
MAAAMASGACGIAVLRPGKRATPADLPRRVVQGQGVALESADGIIEALCRVGRRGLQQGAQAVEVGVGGGPRR